MHRHGRLEACLLAVLGLALFAPFSTAHAGFGDSLKKKLKETETKTTEAVDKATGEAGEAAPGEEAPAGEQASAKAGDAGAGGTLSSVSTKFDYVPGDSVILFDDFTQDELGEFPAQWRLNEGTFEVAEMNGERWLRCTSDDGHVRMKVAPALPEFWTLEFDAYGFGEGSTLQMHALSTSGQSVWETMFPHGSKNMSFRCGEIFSTTALEGSPVTGGHHVMFMARGTGLKVYIDRERLASAPDISGPGTPAEIDFRLWAPGTKVRPMITNVRFAEGCRPAKDMLAEGKLVTYGIHFLSGSDVVLPDSAPVLRQIAAYMQSNPAVKLKVTGHTDNVGSAASNLDLSKRRADAVVRALADQLGIPQDRFTTDGEGDTEPMGSNAKPEGRAMNRRVEFAKA